MQYWTCPLCGANLDPGEDCDCWGKKEENEQKYEELVFADNDGQMTIKEVCA